MPIQYKRLQKIADHLKSGKLGHKKFDFSKFNTNDCDVDFKTGAPNACGTTGCAVGEFPFIFPKHFAFLPIEKWNNGERYSGPRLRENSEGASGLGIECDVKKFLGISFSMFDHLFKPSGNPGDDDFDSDNQNPRRFGGRKLKPYSTALAVANNIEAFIKVMKETKGKGLNAN